MPTELTARGSNWKKNQCRLLDEGTAAATAAAAAGLGQLTLSHVHLIHHEGAGQPVMRVAIGVEQPRRGSQDFIGSEVVLGSEPGHHRRVERVVDPRLGGGLDNDPEVDGHVGVALLRVIEGSG